MFRSNPKGKHAAEPTMYYVVGGTYGDLIYVSADRNKAYRRMAHEIFVKNRNFVHVTTTHPRKGN